MEIFVVLIIILLYCLILEVSITNILLAGAVLLYLCDVVLTLGFAYFTIGIFFSKRKEAKFSRFGRPGKHKFEVAYYLVDGKEYPCIFLKEGVMDDRLYQKNKTYHVLLNKHMKKVYDRFALITCPLGLIFSGIFSIGIGLLLF